MSVHIFDVDYTLVKSSTTYYFVIQGLREKVFAFRQIVRLPYEWLKYKLGMVDPDFIKNGVKLVAGIERAFLEELAMRTFEERIKQNMFAPGVDLVKEIKSRGESVYLATSAFYTLVKPLADFLGVDGVIASRLEFADGKATGKIDGNAVFAHGKKDAVSAWLAEHLISPNEVLFYTDSYSDIPLMEICGSPVAVNPDRFLLRKAKQRGWRVMRFKDTLG